MSALKDDPRDAALEVPYSTPKTWFRDNLDGLGTSGMFLSGLIMVTRNRYLAWPAVLWGLNTMFNAHPLRAKEGTSGWSGLALSFSALFASYIPVFVLTSASPKIL
ncbi:hypothetical protein HYPSUDRAFT_37832 [Hypholoma sublateritium FD-334 SS-4]|uniref:Uncharacterized protein n=1 Tax=Hypholoma sublateritium (strain FD-334 SS-4) TaxID=945553 RepID=A0A0D2P9P4_HYPSF|nr:hypothetical protein HYPSUDRAFT_37832 [Hypholoma sublateritium FD-334 SS-4]